MLFWEGWGVWFAKRILPDLLEKINPLKIPIKGLQWGQIADRISSNLARREVIMAGETRSDSPIGVIPRHLLDERRADSIIEAMFRWRSSLWWPPSEWAVELAETLGRIESRAGEQKVGEATNDV